jgi:hypothetical protein
LVAEGGLVARFDAVGMVMGKSKSALTGCALVFMKMIFAQRPNPLHSESCAQSLYFRFHRQLGKVALTKNSAHANRKLS